MQGVQSIRSGAAPVARVAIAVLVGIVAAGCKKTEQERKTSRQADSPPNILWVILDSVRSDHMTVYGYDKPTTPHLASWAKSARVYDDCLAAAVASTSSYASMFTGLLPSMHQTSHKQSFLPGELVTVAERLEPRYRTFLYSAHPAINNKENFNQGFEVLRHPWEGEYYNDAFEFVHNKVPTLDLTTEITRKIHSLEVSNWALSAAPQYAQKALMSWLQSSDASRPFFACLIYTDAHRPWIPSRECRERMMDDNLVDQSYLVERTRPMMWSYSFGAPEYTDQDLEIMEATYDAAIAELDDAFGALIDGLQAGGFLDHTIVVVTADHGELHGAHHIVGHDFAMYQGLLHVPLIVNYPQRFPAGHDDGEVMNIDVAPTLLELAGVKTAPSDMPNAVSLLSPVNGRARIAEYNAYNPIALKMTQATYPKFDPTPYKRTLRSVVRDGYKLIWGSDGRHALYNLKSDPDETHNLAAVEPERVKALSAVLTSTFAAVDASAAEAGEGQNSSSDIENEE